MAGKFGWLLGERAPGAGQAGSAKEGQLGFTVCDQEGVQLRDKELITWAASNLEWDIVMRLVDVSTSRREHVVVTPAAHVCVGPWRIPMWLQSWKVVSNAAVTFQVTLTVEDESPAILRMRMTQHPLLEFPPLETGLEHLVRKVAGAELVEATSDVDGLEAKGRSYSFRPHLVWEPGKPPEKHAERVYYTTSRELRAAVARELKPSQ
jgi:hypothetical protein